MVSDDRPERYPFADIEARWQRVWEDTKQFRATEDPSRKNRRYVVAAASGGAALASARRPAGVTRHAATTATPRPRTRVAKRECGKRVDNWWNTCGDVADGEKNFERRASRSAASRPVDELRSFVRLIAAVRSLEYRFATRDRSP